MVWAVDCMFVSGGNLNEYHLHLRPSTRAWLQGYVMGSGSPGTVSAMDET